MDMSRGVRERLRQSRKSGNLCLSNLELTVLPEAVVNPRDHIEEDERLYECIDLVKMDINYNSITSLPEAIGNLGEALVVLQAAHNPLQHLPRSLEVFGFLKLLNLSNCQFSVWPGQISHLRSLVELRLDNNRLQDLPAEAFDGLSELQVLNLENNAIRSIPRAVARCSKMIRLHLSKNQLESIPESLGALSQLQLLELRENRLESLSARFTTGLSSLKTLDARRNRLREIPMLPQSPHFRELLLSFNFITQLDAARLLGAAQLSVLDLADNKLESIDSTVADLRNLAFLNVANNNLRGLPHALGYMPKLTRLLTEQNPIRTINRGILTGSCEGLKKYLRSRGPAPASAEQDRAGTGAGMSAWSVVEDHQLVLDKLNDDTAEGTLTEMLRTGKQYETCQTLQAAGEGGGSARYLPLVLRMLDAGQFQMLEHVKFERLSLRQVPIVLSQLPLLTDLSLAFNDLDASSFAELVALQARNQLPVYFPKLQRLNLCRNQLQFLSAALVYGLKGLRELNLSHNRLTTVSKIAIGGGRVAVFDRWAESFPQLETIDLSNNQIGNEGGLEFLVDLGKSLQALNIANNSLSAIPPALGKLVSLRSLLVEVRRLTAALIPHRMKVYFLFVHIRTG